MTAIHAGLSYNAASDEVDLVFYLTRLCSALTEALAAPRGVVLRLEASAPVVVSAAVAQVCGIIGAELVTNALKHAFSLGTARPEIKVTCAGGAIARMDIVDNGLGASGEMPPTASGGAGRTLLERLARRISGTIRVEPSAAGTCVSLHFPLRA